MYCIIYYSVYVQLLPDECVTIMCTFVILSSASAPHTDSQKPREDFKLSRELYHSIHLQVHLCWY